MTVNGFNCVIQRSEATKNLNYNFFRVIDANANRVREGLRVVEDISRFILEDEELTTAWKKARHKTTSILNGLPGTGLLEERNSDSDIGKKTPGPEETKRESFCKIAITNARRAEEGLRVLEEFSKLKSTKAGEEFKKLRFVVYTLEKRTIELLS